MTHQKGSSLLSVLLAVGLVSIVVAGSLDSYNDSRYFRKKLAIYNIANIIYNNVYAHTRNYNSWSNSKTGLTNANAFVCTAAIPGTIAHCCSDTTYNNVPCVTPKVQKFNLYDVVSNADPTSIIVNSLTTTEGYDLAGKPCSAFPSSDCPFRYTLTWQPICMQASCAADGISQVKLSGRFAIAPIIVTSDESKIYIDPDQFNFELIRDFDLSVMVGTNTIKTYSKPGTYTLTPGIEVKSLIIEGWGAGGGGAGGTSFNASGDNGALDKDVSLSGGGGGGGSYLKRAFKDLMGGESLVITVGAGGLGARVNFGKGGGGNIDKLDGSDGGDTVIKVIRAGVIVETITIGGGKGGEACDTTSYPIATDCGLGGVGGKSVVPLTAIKNTVTMEGVSGHNQNETRDQFYDPGKRKKTNGDSYQYDPNNAEYLVPFFGGRGGNAGGGGGIGGVNNRENEVQKPHSPGGGGSGIQGNNSTNSNRLDGADGKIIVTF
jgi:hypothetical protein